MADDEQSTPGSFPGLVQEFIGQLRAAVDKAAGPSPGRPAPPGPLPLPGGLSAAQVASVTESIAAQRRSIEALKTQLSAFDEQLAVLERLLGPLAQWSASWAELEQRLLTLGSRPDAGG